MPQPRHLRSAPITEAIIDFRVKARSGFQVSDFYSLKQSLASGFPSVEEARGYEVKVEVSRAGVGPPVEGSSGLYGYLFKSSDGKLIAQFRVDGFTLNRLKPYTQWGDFFSIAMGLWQNYCEIASPELLTRIALRYINHIPLPSLTLSDLGRCLRSAPTIPPELPQFLTESFSRITICDLERGLSAHVLQAIRVNDQTGRAMLVLDIDSFKVVKTLPADFHPEGTFSELRDFKNRIFFNYLSEETLRTFL